MGETMFVVPTCCPGLMQATLLPELLSQVVKSLQATDLGQQPLLIALLHLLQTLPGIGNILETEDELEMLITMKNRLHF